MLNYLISYFITYIYYVKLILFLQQNVEFDTLHLFKFNYDWDFTWYFDFILQNHLLFLKLIIKLMQKGIWQIKKQVLTKVFILQYILYIILYARILFVCSVFFVGLIFNWHNLIYLIPLRTTSWVSFQSTYHYSWSNIIWLCIFFLSIQVDDAMEFVWCVVSFCIIKSQN